MPPFPTRRRIYLMRHGEVNYFVDGQPVPPPEAKLNAIGKEQARAAGHVLAEISFDRVVATGLSRTMETAAIVLRAREQPADLHIEANPGLQEIRGTRTIDLPRAELEPLFLNSMTSSVSAENRFLNGEKYGEFAARVVPAFELLVAEQNWQHLLLVAHGAVNRAILTHILHAPIETMGHIEQDAGCINLIDIDQRGFGIVRLLNYTPENPSKQGMQLTTMERYFLDFPQSREE
jgi:broad specificity phosphatase PhoE